jgi:RNA polymerase sigma factor (sigma-70 family)
VELEPTLRELAPRLLRYCCGRLGDRGVAEEVSQDALSALAIRWQRLGPPDSPEGFAFAVARRRCFRALTRRRLFAPLAVAANGSHPDPSPERELLDRDGLAHTVAAIRRLGSGDREVLLLVAVAGLSGPAAARLLGISVAAMKMRVWRARRRLLELLEPNHAKP